MEEQLIKAMKPIIISSWNLNFDEKCKEAKVRFAYFPEEYDGDNPPRIRFDLIMESGRTQSNFNCCNPFIELVNCISTSYYERMIGLQ